MARRIMACGKTFKETAVNETLLKLTEHDTDCMYPPRYLIYCWQCDEVEVMKNGIASDAFRVEHREHKHETQRIDMRWRVRAV